VTESLKLTSYFGERQRCRDGFVADALLELYGRHELATSILLRGTEGFGLKHHLRTDRSLSLSEDLPLITVAVDTRPRIEAVLPHVLKLTPAGLVTLERARLLADTTAPDDRPETAKLTVYLGRQERVFRVPAFVAVCDLLHRRGVDGATALLGVDGTAHGQRERAAFFSRNADVPMMVIAIGPGDQIGRVLPELGALLRRPLLTLERVQVLKRDGRLLAAPAARPGAGQWQKLMIYTSEATQYHGATHHGQALHRCIVRRLRSAGISGATTLRGIWGFHGDHAPHGDRLLQRGRRVPAVTIVVDTRERIATAFGVIDELTSDRGLVTVEDIPAVARSEPGRERSSFGIKIF
jgi:PII-like signaling protein